MKRHNDVIKGSSVTGMGQLESPRSWSRFISLALITLLALTTLACAFLGANSRSASRSVIIRNRLPTLTSTPQIERAPAAVASPQVTVVAAAPVMEPEIPQQPTAAVPTAAVATPDFSLLPGQNVEAANPPAMDAFVSPTQVANPPLLPAATLTARVTETPTLLATSVTAIPDIESAGWAFTGVQVYTGQVEDGLLLYGDVINNTGTAQELENITGTFYDEQGQVIADEDTLNYWPVQAMPPGSEVPFELTVFGIESAARFDLRVEAQQSREFPRQDFKFLDVQVQAESNYCLAGKIQNPGTELQYYLSIVAVLYDSQDNVINFNDHYNHSPEGLAGDQTFDFEICVDPLNQTVARHELRAWGL